MRRTVLSPILNTNVSCIIFFDLKKQEGSTIDHFHLFKRKKLNFKITFLKMFNMDQEYTYSLDLYRDILNCYEQLCLKFRIAHEGQTLDINLMSSCLGKIEILLNLESEEWNHSNFSSDVCNSLILIRKQLLCLMRQPLKLRTQNVLGDSVQNILNCKSNDLNEKHIDAIVPKVKGLSEVAGMDDIKKSLIAIIVLPKLQPQLYIHQKFSNSILLYGPPGTGKTRLAHAIAAEASVKLFSIACSDILSHYVGITEKSIKATFCTVKNEVNGAVLFIDEIDGLCQRRQSNDTDWSRRLKTELMCQLTMLEDTPNKYLICATNCPWDLDSAIVRRFQRRIYVPLPNKEDRTQLIKYLTKDMSIEINREILTLILEKTEGYSCSDLTDVIRYATNQPIYELCNTQLWERVGDNKYKPAEAYRNVQNHIKSNIIQMPPQSIQHRRVEIYDIIKSLDVIKPTVSVNELIKYEEFSN